MYDQFLSWQLVFKTYLQPHHPTTSPVLLRGTGMMPRLEHLPPTSVVKDYSWPNAIQFTSGAWKKVPSRTSNLSSLLAQFERDQTRSLPSRSLIRQTNTGPGKAKRESYSSQGQAGINFKFLLSLVLVELLLVFTLFWDFPLGTLVFFPPERNNIHKFQFRWPTWKTN